MTEQSTQLPDADQRIATRNAQALADDHKATVDRQRKEIEDLKEELARARDVVGSMVNQYMSYPEGYVTHEFMSAQEDAIEYLEDIGWLKGGELERYYWTPTSGHVAPLKGNDNAA